MTNSEMTPVQWGGYPPRLRSCTPTKNARLTLKSEATLSGLLEEADLRKGESGDIIAELNKYTAPNKYRVEQYFDLEIIPEEGNRRLQRLTFEKTLLETVMIERDGDILTSSLYEAPTLTERRLLVVPFLMRISNRLNMCTSTWT